MKDFGIIAYWIIGVWVGWKVCKLINEGINEITLADVLSVIPLVSLVALVWPLYVLIWLLGKLENIVVWRQK